MSSSPLTHKQTELAEHILNFFTSVETLADNYKFGGQLSLRLEGYSVKDFDQVVAFLDNGTPYQRVKYNYEVKAGLNVALWLE